MSGCFLEGFRMLLFSSKNNIQKLKFDKIFFSATLKFPCCDRECHILFGPNDISIDRGILYGGSARR